MLRYQTGKCLVSISPLSKCSKCCDICDKEAITLTSNGPQINANCNSCGVCVYTCSENALSLSTPLFITQYTSQKRLIVGCGAIHKKEVHFSVPCLASIDLEDILKYVSKKNIITIVKGNCSQCIQCKAKQQVDLLLARLRFFQQSLGFEKDSIFIEEREQKQTEQDQAKKEQKKSQPQNLSRRDLFSFFFRPISSASSPLLEKEKPEEKFQNRFKPYISKCKTLLPSRLKFAFAFDIPKNCDGCGVCVQLCPSSALQTKENEQTKQLLFFQNLCNGCGLCVDVCKFKDAQINAADLESTDNLPAKKILLEFEKKECIQCGFPLLQAIGSDNISKLCFVCQKKKSLTSMTR